MKHALAAILLGALLAAPATAQTVTPAFQHAIPNVPGKEMVAVVVDYPPGGKSGAHRHAPSAFIFAYVLEGEIRSQVDDQPAKVYKAGESWYENPGAHHKVSENASATKPAKLLAVFVVNPGEVLVSPDKK